MTILSQIPNGASNKDIRETLNNAMTTLNILKLTLAGIVANQPGNVANNKLKARPAPAEPDPYVFNNGVGGVNSEAYQVPVTDYDIDITLPTDGPWKIFMGADATFTNGVSVETRNTGHFGIRTVDNGNTVPSYADYVPYNHPSVDYHMRIRRKGTSITIFVTDMEVPVVTYNDVTRLIPENRWIKVINFYDTRNSFTKMEVKPTSLVTDRLVLSNTVLDSKTGKLTTDIDYYLAQDDYLTGQIESIGGEIVVPAENYKVIENTVPGKAKVELVTPVPSSKRGSRVRIRTKSPIETTLFDTKEVTYPGDTNFGQNVAGVFDVFRPIRTTSNMMQQGYWQDSHGGSDSFRTYGRESTGVLDSKGWPLRGNLYFWYPLPDQRNQEVKYVLKWDGGPINISHFATSEGFGIRNIGPILRPDANTLTWTMTADRTIGVHDITGRFVLESIDTANPPKNMTLCLEGDDLSKRWLPSFINFLKLLPGRLRFMDNQGVNGERYYLNRTWDWSKRAVQDNGAACGFAVEDMIELCNRSGRPLLYNIHASYAYETGGMEYFRNELDLLYGKTQGQYFTPGFSAPTGVVKKICPEIGNENWNPGFGGWGTYHYLADKGVTLGLVPADNGSGGARHANLIKMRNLVQIKLMTELETRITDWRARTVRVLGIQLAESDFLNITNQGDWETARLHVDEMVYAPYIPGDPNAGSSSANIPDKTPAGVCAFLAATVANDIGPNLARCVSQTLNAGFIYGVYEVNVATISLGLTLEQNKALNRSQEYYDLWKNTIIPMLVGHGGDIALYMDIGAITTGEQWSLLHVLDSDLNKSWDAVVDWTAAHPST